MEEAIIKRFLAELTSATSRWELSEKFDDFIDCVQNEVYGSELRDAWLDLKIFKELKQKHEKN